MVKNTEEDMDQVEKTMNIVEMLAALAMLGQNGAKITCKENGEGPTAEDMKGRVEWLAVAFGDIKGMVGP